MILQLAAPLKRVMGGTDCGFAQSPFAQRVHPTIMWAKLKSLVENLPIADLCRASLRSFD